MSPHSTSGAYDAPPGSTNRKDSNTSPVILIRNLAKSLDSAALESMMLFAQGMTSVDFVSNPADEHRFKTAMARFSSNAAAQEAKNMLDGKWNSSKDAHLIVNYVPLSPGGSASLRRLIDGAPGPKFNGSFSTFDQVSPTMPTTGFSPNELARSESFSMFPPTGPLGSPIERQRMSGKSMISEDADDETGKLINDPIAFAKNDMANTQTRRSTMPQLPFNRLANLSISSPTGSNGMTSPRGVQSPSTYSSHGMNTPANIYAHNMQYPRTNMPPVNPADQNPPCNTLYVGNLPQDTAEDELKLLFSKQRGYKRLCFRVKQQGPMCFVEFEDVTFATKTLHELYGHMLSNSVKGGIRLSFSKNPLGVRANQPNGLASPLSPQGVGMSYGNMVAFAAASGPPPGLAMPSPYVPMSPTHNGYSYNTIGNTYGPISPSASSGLHSRSPNGMAGGPWGPTNGDYQYGRPLYG